jgi:hypothetical protein
MKAADGGGLPAVIECVIDDRTHDPRSGVCGAWIVTPQTLIGRRDQVGAQHATVLPATPYMQPDASVSTLVSAEVAAEFGCPPELIGADAQDA